MRANECANMLGSVLLIKCFCSHNQNSNLSHAVADPREGLKQMSLTTLLMPSRSGTRSDQVVTLRMVAARPGAPRRRAPCGRGLS